MAWIGRLLLFLPVMFLIATVYAGQRHDNARDTLHSALRLTFEGVVSLALLVLAMQLLAVLFID